MDENFSLIFSIAKEEKNFEIKQTIGQRRFRILELACAIISFSDKDKGRPFFRFFRSIGEGSF